MNQPPADGIAMPDSVASAGDTGVIMFTADNCAVCGVVKPRIVALLRNNFPLMPLQVVDCRSDPDLAACHAVRSVPTVIVRFAGQEIARRERVFSLAQLAEDIERPYRIYFAV